MFIRDHDISLQRAVMYRFILEKLIIASRSHTLYCLELFVYHVFKIIAIEIAFVGWGSAFWFRGLFHF
jgi:hypothetical protein